MASTNCNLFEGKYIMLTELRRSIVCILPEFSMNLVFAVNWFGFVELYTRLTVWIFRWERTSGFDFKILRRFAITWKHWHCYIWLSVLVLCKSGEYSKGRKFDCHRGHAYFSSLPGVNIHSEYITSQTSLLYLFFI